jgi:hypothetical protein
VWAAVGYDFKSEIVFYEVPSNTNGKITLKVYRDQILEPHVKRWIQEGQDFVLEEDQDGSHGTIVPVSGPNIVQIWKKENGLEHFFNISHSPDLSPIENVWGLLKAYVRKWPHWSKQSTKELIQEGWDEKVSQEAINRLIDSIPARLQAVLEAEGKMTGY